MIEKTIKTDTVFNDDDIQVVYNLFFQNAFYSLECYIKGSNKKEVKNYYLAENFTDDEGEAENLLRRMVKGKVFPVHIKDMVEDYIICH